MSYLFQVENESVLPYPETLMVYPFSAIWKGTKSKEVAMKKFAYIEFMSSKLRSNPYSQLDKKTAHNVISKNLVKGLILQGADANFWEDPLVQEGIRFLENAQNELSISYSIYISFLNAVKELENYYNTLRSEDIKDPQKIQNSLTNVEQLMKTTQSLKTSVERELYEEVKVHGGAIISLFSKRESFILTKGKEVDV